MASRERSKPRPARPSTAPEKAPQPLLPPAMHTLREEGLTINLETLPPASPVSAHDVASSEAGYDWATFIHAYACGRWDPQRTPRPPCASFPVPPTQESSPTKELPEEVPMGALAFERPRPPPPQPSHRLRASFSAVSSLSSASPSPGPRYPAFLPGTFPTISASTAAEYPSASPTYQSTPYGTTSIHTPNTASHLDLQTSAATLRWAGARVRVAPLALPSPEHELVDPMRRAAAVPIPGSHPDFDFAPPHTHSSYPHHAQGHTTSHSHASNAAHPEGTHPAWQAHLRGGAQTPGWDMMTPGGTRRARLSGFWSGTADVDADGGYAYSYSDPQYGGMLPTIDASPATPERERGVLSVPASVSAHVSSVHLNTHAPVSEPAILSAPASEAPVSQPLQPIPHTRPPPATAPVRTRATDGDGGGDYFGAAVRRSRGGGGLRTPPASVEGSPSDVEEGPGGGEGGDETTSKEPQTRAEAPAQTMTTPDSNPARPPLGRAVTEGSGEGSGSGEIAPYDAEVKVADVSPPPVHTSDADSSSASSGTAQPNGTLDHAEPEDDSSDANDISVARPATVSASTSFSSTSSSLDLGASASVSDSDSQLRPAAKSTSTSASTYSASSSRVNGYPLAGPLTGNYLDLAHAMGPHSVPAPVPRRGVLARQMSAPLPVGPVVLGGCGAGVRGMGRARRGRGRRAIPGGMRAGAGRQGVAGEESGSGTGTGTGSQTQTAPSAHGQVHASEKGKQKAERAYAARGYLAPPYPPDELGRRRALYKFNIMNTGPDLNFDRIAHLAKLVFNTKGVVISVVDGESEWFKSEWGISKAHSCAREESFCGHAILQRGDEPMIVLDSQRDWRFAKNPLVLGAPSVRFYAGAPLRTHDGFNIGCLALIDDAPREDFTPRQRHTLKEFAAIAMREMELWRDKIQLRIRDRIQNSMEQFSRECLEIDSEPAGNGNGKHGHGVDGLQDKGLQPPQDKHQLVMHDSKHFGPHSPRAHDDQDAPRDPPDLMGPASSMDTVYDRAAKLVQRTLDVEGVVVLDVSHCEVLESMNAESTVAVVLHHGDPDVPTSTRTLSVDEYARLAEFFARFPEGKISEGIVPPTFRLFLPQAHIQYALTVPIYNIDKRPFALLCAWNASDQSKRFLEGHELSYLRAIGVIILSAVLKRRMMLADKAKSLFISNISHELRTPLHGILAAAELLGDSPLNHSQLSFLQTVQACGTSLVETVNHVLDFTKLSGNSKAGGVENVIVQTKVDLMQLVEEAVDGCWIGHRARTAIMGDTGIGSVYSPPEDTSAAKQVVETVVEIGWRRGGWSLKCERGGIRRVLMNVFGNSLKFTTNGYVHVLLRELPRSADEEPDETKVELVVLDTGKNQLFHPFSQENPLQTGTGLGLAIVNSIVKSESVNGKVDVWSEEGIGTEIKVTFSAQIAGDEGTAPEMEPFKFDDPMHPVTVSLVGFDDDHKGIQLLNTVMQTYLVSWWGFEVRPSGQEHGDIVILNEDVEPVKKATAERNTSRPFIILSTLRGNTGVMAIASEHERIGGFCRVIYKPGGPSRLHALLKLCLHAIKIGQSGRSSPDSIRAEPVPSMAHVSRRNSEENNSVRAASARPMMSPRSSTVHPLASTSWRTLSSTSEHEEPSAADEEDEVAINIGTAGTGGTLLRSSIGTINSDERRFRVLVVEDNTILRNLLVRWLTGKGYDHRNAVDGRNGVSVYKEDGPFDVVLLDMSMPVLDGLGATAEIRELEARWLVDDPNSTPTRILALTGRSSLEDKRKAFEAGVDGYLVKPVAFKTLDEMFSKLGVS
ncbi:hypothetical protein B0H17DRAFT_1078584 [Mycena rosella]|uniref:histidine kinase n=1 Tax=Mycena rosella TaxID=1033263 RepID=A0AAD7D4S9_MYCRO|nr:hypothetical protein B0H17DRAFT_1078584 [Mycena rosella]